MQITKLVDFLNKREMWMRMVPFGVDIHGEGSEVGHGGGVPIVHGVRLVIVLLLSACISVLESNRSQKS